MKIQKIVSQHRRDMQCVYKCEHCGHTHEAYGYDDDNFHRNVVPGMMCPECGKKADPGTYRPLGTKHPESAVV